MRREELTIGNFEAFKTNLTPLNFPEWNDGKHIFVDCQFNNQYFDEMFRDFMNLEPFKVVMFKQQGSIVHLCLRMTLASYDNLVDTYELNNPKKPNWFRCLYFHRVTKEIAYKFLLIDSVFEVSEVKKQLALLTTQSAFKKIKTVFAGVNGFIFFVDHSTKKHRGFYYFDYADTLLRRYEDTLEIDMFANRCLAENNQTLKYFAKFFTKNLVIKFE